MQKKVGVIGIDLDRLRSSFGSRALSLSGNNFGNILFTNAVYRQIPGCQHLGFMFDPDKVKVEFDHLVIPAANWINQEEDWGFLADLIERADLPVCLVGLGTQLTSIEAAEAVPTGTVRLLREVSKRSSAIGARGSFTKKVLERLGFTSVEALGCPSIFNGNTVPLLRDFKAYQDMRIGVGPTRYELPKNGHLSPNNKQMKLYRYAIREAASIYYQSEAFEIALLNREEVSDQRERALAYYELSNFSVLEDLIMKKGKYHKDIDQWRCDSVKDDVYIGTRIHGAIASILSGTPAVLITHDNRTVELAEIMGIPSMPISEFDGFYESSKQDFFNGFDYSIFSEVSRVNISRLSAFYKNNGLMSNLIV